jgi:hypothetical protein
MSLKPPLENNLTRTEVSAAKDANAIEDKTTWVYWTIICVSIILAFAIAISLYELICRFRDKLIFDGGPPATPTHTFSYIVGVKSDRASSSFDPQVSVLKVELLDRFNRYVTSIAVPCFLLKFKVIDDGPPPEKSAQKMVPPVFIKTMTVLQEQWAPTSRAELINFQLVRRRPLTDVASARILHDCFNRDAFIMLKYIVFHDPLANINFMINLKEQQIKAIHPCPPTCSQVFPVEKLTTPNEDLKSFMESTKAQSSMCCTSCYGKSNTINA